MNAVDREQHGSTPTQPSPLQGEGYPLVDRFARTSRIKDGGVARARKLRAAPTHAEAKLWKHLRLLPVRFRRQAPIGPYVVDFACHPARLVIEVDGGIHDTTDVALRDLKRDDWLAAQGCKVIRFTNRQVEDDIDRAIKTIAAMTPFPLEGGRAGDGGGATASPATLEESAASSTDDRVNAADREQHGSTPTQPSPLQGEGFSINES